jgi:hypothetical protein
MVPILKVVGLMSCGFLLCLGLSNAAQAGNAPSAADEKKSGQSDYMKQVTLITGVQPFSLQIGPALRTGPIPVPELLSSFPEPISSALSAVSAVRV